MYPEIHAQPMTLESEFAQVSGTPLQVSRVGLGTWAMGGWMWGGTDESESVATIRAALNQGINLIDTAPAYGFGLSEQIVGKALWGSRRPDQLRAARGVAGWSLGPEGMASIERILSETITDPIGPEFLAPPHRSPK